MKDSKKLKLSIMGVVFCGKQNKAPHNGLVAGAIRVARFILQKIYIPLQDGVIHSIQRLQGFSPSKTCRRMASDDPIRRQVTIGCNEKKIPESA